MYDAVVSDNLSSNMLLQQSRCPAFFPHMTGAPSVQTPTKFLKSVDSLVVTQLTILLQIFFLVVRPSIDCRPASFSIAFKLSSMPLINTKSCAVSVESVVVVVVVHLVLASKTRAKQKNTSKQQPNMGSSNKRYKLRHPILTCKKHNK